MTSASTDSSYWPGKSLGLPATGPRSVARFGRRLVGLLIDWGLASVISASFFSPQGWANVNAIATLVIFAVAQVLFLLTLNGSIGHLLTGLRVVPAAGGYLGVWRPFARTILLCVVIPAVIWDKDQRGMHDRLIGTVLVRR